MCSTRWRSTAARTGPRRHRSPSRRAASAPHGDSLALPCKIPTAHFARCCVCAPFCTSWNLVKSRSSSSEISFRSGRSFLERFGKSFSGLSSRKAVHVSLASIFPSDSLARRSLERGSRTGAGSSTALGGCTAAPCSARRDHGTGRDDPRHVHSN